MTKDRLCKLSEYPGSSKSAIEPKIRNKNE